MKNYLKSWLAAAAIYADRRVLAILFLGFASGLPLALTSSTLYIWLAEQQVRKTAIGLFAMVAAPYTFKFLWSPLIDQLPLPFFTRRLGQRRGWAVFTQLLLMAAIFCLGATDPGRAPLLTAWLALLVAFCSASQDIVIDAYRVEVLPEHQYGAGAAMIVLGYRLGMLASGAGALYLSSFFGWFATYAVMAALLSAGIITMLLNLEPARRRVGGTGVAAAQVSSSTQPLTGADGQRPAGSKPGEWVRAAIVAPFAEFMGRKGWMLILLFILLYKFGEALAGVMSNPFYIELGFSKIEIANVSKAFGLAATIAGGVIGGMLVSRLGIMRSLLVCGILQMLSTLAFVLQAVAGHNLHVLILTIGIENLSGGMGTAAFVAYLSSLCNVAYTATQYALLSSFMAFGRTMLASSGGWLADQMSWPAFFLTTTVAALPGLILLMGMKSGVETSNPVNPVNPVKK